MKLWYRFVCAFVAVAVVLFSVRVFDVDADEDAPVQFTIDRNGHVVRFNCYQSDLDVVNELKENNYPYGYDNGKSVDAYTALMAEAQNRDIFEGSSSSDIFPLFCRTYDFGYWFYYLDFTDITDVVDVSFDYYINDGAEYGTFNIYPENLPIKNFYFRNDAGEGINSINYNSDNTSCGGYYDLYFFPFLDDYEFASLKFIINPELSDSMDMNNLNTNFTIDVENETDNAYNYCIYISSQPASVGIVNSLQSANYFLSSKQWCYVFQQDYQLDADLIDQIKNNVSDNYTTTDIIDYLLKGAPITNLTNVWGGVYNGAKEYIALKNNSMSFYSLVQTNCPVYLIRSNSNRSHVVDYASLNVDLDTQYYLNIIYYQPDMNVVGAIGSSTAALVSAATGEDMIYPIYNVDFFRDYTVYDSIPFSFVNGTFSISEDDVTKYNDVVQNSNPANSTANISSDDDNVNINNSNSYDSSVKTNYYNYGTIYHNCSWSGSGSGGSSGARPSVPELPESEFEDLYDQSGNFFDFVADVLDAVGAVPMLFITAAFAVLLFLRIWGR